MSTVFMPLNRRMVETVVSHADLLREDTIPEPLKELCAHVACYEPIVARWQEDGFNSVQLDDHVSVAGNFPRKELAAYVKTSFESLKLEQARLLAQTQRLRRPRLPHMRRAAGIAGAVQRGGEHRVVGDDRAAD